MITFLTICFLIACAFWSSKKAKNIRQDYINADPHVCDRNFWELQPGRDSGSTGESRYGCPVCDAGEFRGGWGSSIWLEKDYEPQHNPKKRK